MTPLNGHPRSHPYPRPAGDHHIRGLADEAVMLVVRSGSKLVANRAFFSYSAVANEWLVGRSRSDCLLRPAERLSRTPEAMPDNDEPAGHKPTKWFMLNHRWRESPDNPARIAAEN